MLCCEKKKKDVEGSEGRKGWDSFNLPGQDEEDGEREDERRENGMMQRGVNEPIDDGLNRRFEKRSKCYSQTEEHDCILPSLMLCCNTSSSSLCLI